MRPIINSHIHFKQIDAIDATHEFMSSIGMERLGIACIYLPDDVDNNPAALAFKARYPDTTWIFGNIEHRILGGDREVDAALLAEQARAMIAAGFDGIKLLETKPSVDKTLPYRIDDPVFRQFFGIVEKAGMPVIWHVADPDENWTSDPHNREARERGWTYGDGTYPSKDDYHRMAENVLGRFPALKVSLAHFYFLSRSLPRLDALLARFPAVNLDITPGTEMFCGFAGDRTAAMDFFIRHANRIMYGDDTSVWGSGVDPDGIREKVAFIRRFLETEDTFSMPAGDENFLQRDCTVTGIALPDDVLEKIYRTNFIRIAGASPRPLNRDAARVLCRQAGKTGKKLRVEAQVRAVDEAVRIIDATDN